MLLLASGFGSARAQGMMTGPPPIHSRTDAQGVDLISGNLNVSTTDVLIGQGAGVLAYTRIFIGSGWTDNLGASLVASNGNTVTVSFGAASEIFNDNNGVYTPAQGQGSTLTFDGGSLTYTYTAADGTVVLFPFGTRATKATHPNGLTLTYTYQKVLLPSGCTPGITCQTFFRVSSANNNLGYQLKLSYQSDTANTTADLPAWTTVKTVIGVNSGETYCDPAANNCDFLLGSSTTWPRATYAMTVGPSTVVTKTDALNRVTSYTYDAQGRLTSVQSPSGSTNPTTIAYIGSTTQVLSVSNGTGAWHYAYSLDGSINTTTVTDPLTHTRKVVSLYDSNLMTSLVTSDTDGNGHATSYLYDSFGRTTRVTRPEGDFTTYGYDARGNVQTTTRVAKPGSPPSLLPIVTTADYDAACGFPAKCNKPNRTTDALGAQTDILYYNSTGQPFTITAPAPTGDAVRPQTRFTYTPLSAWYKNSAGNIVQATAPVHELTGVSNCQTRASCGGTADEVKQTIAYVAGNSGQYSNLAVASVSAGAGDGSLTATTTTTYDAIGNLIEVQGPLNGNPITTALYDGARQLVGVVGPNPGAGEALYFAAARYTYNGDGRVTLAERGTVAPSRPGDWTSFNNMFTSLRSVRTDYDSVGRTDWRMVGNTSFVQFAYDNANNPLCTAVRMNHANFGSTQWSACALAPAGSGPPDNIADQITVDVYDNANQLTKVTEGYFTPAQRNYVQATYTPNGLVATVTDASNNQTGYTYDGFDRLQYKNFPLPTRGAGTPNPNDFESYTYDANGNLLKKRQRDLSQFFYTYDALNRLILTQSPDTTTLPDVAYGYDNLSRLLFAHYGSAGGAGVDYTYDALGRTLTEAAASGAMAYQYDLAGERTQITWPDAGANALFVSYVYDGLGRVIKIGQNGAGSGPNLLAAYTYDPLGNITQIARSGGAGATTDANYDNADRLNALTQRINGPGAAVTWTPSYTYNPSPQVYSEGATSTAYTYHPPASDTRYGSNGLNQYLRVGSQTYTYGDGRGNLTSVGVLLAPPFRDGDDH